jgi:hypothetical protein
MKIAFYLLREPALKVMGPLVEAARKRGHEALLLYPRTLPTGDKAYQSVNKNKLEVLTRQGMRAHAIETEELVTLSEVEGVDALVTLEGYYSLGRDLETIKTLRKHGVIVVSLAHFFENIRMPLESLDYFDKTYYLSQFAVDAHLKLARIKDPTAAMAAEKYEATGSPMFDQIAGIDPAAVRKKIGVPAGKPVVVLFAPAIVAETRWRFLMWTTSDRWKRIAKVIRRGEWGHLWDAVFTPTMREIAHAVRNLCDRNNAFLILKTRAKQRELQDLIEVADLYLDGRSEEYFPAFTSYQLLSVASLCIGFMSLSIVEAAGMDVPVWNVYVPTSEYESKYNHDYLEAVMGKGKETPFEFEGIRNLSASELIALCRKSNLANLKQPKLEANSYKERFLGFGKKASSERILDSIEALVGAAA